MKIFIVGTGAVGSVLINALAKFKEFDPIYCVTNDKKQAEMSIKPNRRVKLFIADINDTKKVEKLAKGSSLIINAASPWLNIKIMKLALKAGANYQDLESYLGCDDGVSKTPYKIEHLALEKEFKRKNLCALFDAGVAPGLTNLVVAHAADKGKLKTARIRFIEDTQSSVAFSTWSPAATMDELQSRPIIYENGKFVLLERFSREENFKFPVPFGKKITYPIMNNESFTIPHYLKLKNIDVRSSGSDMEVAKMMVGMGLLGMKPISINGTNVSPMDLLIKILPPTPTPAEIKDLIKKGLLKDGFFEISIETIASNGKIKKYWMPFPSQKELIKRNINSTYIAYPTGICAAAFALEMHNIKKSGVFPPEGMPKINRANVLKNMKRLGLKINI